MPTSLRSSRSRLGSRSSTWPATSIRPDWQISSPLMQRSSVLLPEPLRPMMATTCPASTLSDTPFRTSTGPKRLCTSSMTTAGMHCPFKIAAETGERKADQEIDRRHGREDLERPERRVVDELPRARQLDKPDNRDDRCVLHQLNQEADRGRQRYPDRLRNDDVAVLLRTRQRER